MGAAARLACLASPDALEAAAPPERRAAVGALVEALGTDWAAATSRSNLVVRHAPSGQVFAVVPGGRFVMGLRPGDVEAVKRQIRWSSEMASSLKYDGKTAVPPHEVEVRPFLCAQRLLAGVPRPDALRTAKELGFRLPSEAELEWLNRDGDRYALLLGARGVPKKPGRFVFQESRFGVKDLVVGQWAADDWHPSYKGAPATSEPWMAGEPEGVCRNTAAIHAMVSDADVAVLFAALRTRGTKGFPGAVRLALSLPL